MIMDTECWSYNEQTGLYHFNDDYIGVIDLPPNITSCRDMFANCHIKEGCSFGVVRTGRVEDMSGMFSHCRIDAGVFSKNRPTFRASRVLDMSRMFEGAVMPADFNLGPAFFMRRVEDMSRMFAKTVVPKYFVDRLDTSTATTLAEMFDGAILRDINILKLMDTKNVKDFSAMFRGTYLRNPVFSDNFTFESAETTREMFAHCRIDGVFVAGPRFDITGVDDTVGMFAHCHFPSYVKECGTPEAFLTKLKGG